MNIDKIISNAVAGVSAALSSAPRHNSRFAFPITKEDAALLLAQSYRLEVEILGGYYDPNTITLDHIKGVGRWLTDSSLKPSLLLYGSSPGTGKTTMALAVKRMAEALHEKLRESIDAAVEDLDEQVNEHFSNWERIPYPEGLSPQELPAPAGMQKRMEWREAHPDEAAIIDEAEARKDAAIKAWRQPFESEIEAAQARADRVARMQPRYVTAQALADLIRDRNYAEYNSCVFAPFLILDDIGTEPPTVKDFGNEYLPVTDLLLKRYERRLPTIITTNLPLTATPDSKGDERSIRGIYGVRIMDRLNEICEKVAYGGKSFRSKDEAPPRERVS